MKMITLTQLIISDILVRGSAFLSSFFQHSIIKWSRDHRLHHKFSETDADPHNAKRGFFFSHIGWLLFEKHPLCVSQGKTVDVSDLNNDPVCSIQRRLVKCAIF